MRILICGASGFLGQAFEQTLTNAGHQVVRGLRQPRQATDLAFDFAAPDHAAWRWQLDGFDAVINCVGILVESDAGTFLDLHQRGPQTLFAACADAGIRRIVHISALGAERADTPYLASKYEADRFLMRLPVNWQILRPSLIYGPDGRSARFFRLLASLPVLFLPAGGKQSLQPIHIDDLCATVAVLLDPATPARQCLALVGPTPITLKQMLLEFRRAMGFAPAPCLSIPAGLMRAGACLLAQFHSPMLTPDNWKMLQAGSTADVRPLTAVLGRAPRELAEFISPEAGKNERQAALFAWRNPLLRIALALVWLLTAFVCLFVYPVEDSLQLLAPIGLTGLAAEISLYGAILLDFGLGWATLFRPGRRLWLAQIFMVTFYSAVIAIFLPEVLSHPFGPILKNLPILALLLILFSEENAQ